ncbi:MAG: NAD(P)/FAD-dependent oxidoreductase [Candidatus Coproplasma sp.]
MYDCIIIGTGAAGVSAALTLKALKIDFLWLGDKNLSRKIRSAEQIKNYPGLNSVSGEEMQRAFISQIEDAGIEITQGKVNGVYPMGNSFSVMCGQIAYEGRTVIIATGVETIKAVKGETEYLGRGVSYCAVCDGFLYKGKTIAVYCESAEEIKEVELLAKYASQIYLFCPEKIKFEEPNVTRVGSVIKEMNGDLRIRSVVGESGEEFAVDGVFMLKQAFGADTLVYGLRTEGGAVVTDKDQSTSVVGVFAAGDCTGRPFQYAKAVGEGNVCAYSVNAYLKSGKVG